MKILVINSGSSSIKYKFFNDDREMYHGIKEEVTNYKNALDEIFEMLVTDNIVDSISHIDAVGHRVVHGGEKFHDATLVDDNVIETIHELIPLAPLHNPVNLEAIKIIHEYYSDIPQVAVFDTAFHQTMPKMNYIYPIRKDLYENNHIRKYGFHGTSHSFVSKKVAKYLNQDINNSNFITLHLGNGASACAIKDGKSYDTSMGFTPLDGLMMGTRSGTIDPEIIIYMHQQLNIEMDEIDNILNKQSGLKGLCGKSDVREILQDAKDGNEDAILSLNIFTQRVKEYIGNYFIQLQKVDAIIFTGGIGEHSSFIREKICEGLESIGAILDGEKNKNITDKIEIISRPESQIKLIIAPTNEEKAIAIQTQEIIAN